MREPRSLNVSPSRAWRISALAFTAPIGVLSSWAIPATSSTKTGHLLGTDELFLRLLQMQEGFLRACAFCVGLFALGFRLRLLFFDLRDLMLESFLGGSEPREHGEERGREPGEFVAVLGVDLRRAGGIWTSFRPDDTASATAVSERMGPVKRAPRMAMAKSRLRARPAVKMPTVRRFRARASSRRFVVRVSSTRPWTAPLPPSSRISCHATRLSSVQSVPDCVPRTSRTGSASARFVSLSGYVARRSPSGS